MRITDLRTKIAKKLGAVLVAGAAMLPATAIVTGGLMFAGEAEATELVSNGSFEAGGSWTGGFSSYDYVADVYYSGPAVPASFSPGSIYSWNSNGSTQSVDLTLGASTAEIDSGNANYDFSAWLAGYAPQADHANVQLEWFDGGAGSLGTIFFDGSGGVTTHFVQAADGETDGSLTTKNEWKLFNATGVVPSTARTATLSLLGVGNDNYVDLMSLDVSPAPSPAPEPATATIALLGGLFLAGRRRRRTRE